MNGEEIAELSLARLHDLLRAGEVRSVDLVRAYVERYATIDAAGPTLRSILEINPDAEAIAAECDRERDAGAVRGPLHGIPVLLKDNIDTADRMHTTAGSLALMDTPPAADSCVAARLRAAGAVLLGKTNMSEWANFRSSFSSSGWSARGGQCRNPYALDRSPCGSSSGSGAAIAASLAAGAIGTETNGSILCPSAMCGIVGLKPTVGLVSRAGIIPISHTQDTAGPMTRTVTDAAILLSAIAGPDPRDPATANAPEGIDYTRALDANGLRGARIGVARKWYFGYSEKMDPIFEQHIAHLRELGAEVIDPANIPSHDEMRSSDAEEQLLLYEFKADLNAYLAQRGAAVRTLADLIAFNKAHAEQELAIFGQDELEASEQKGPLTDEAYLAALRDVHRLSRDEGLDAVFDEHRLDALIAPSTGPAWYIDHINGDSGRGGSSGPAAMAGYPSLTVPAGYVQGLPVGLTFMGRAWTEETLLRLAYSFEQATQVRQPPTFPERT